MEPKHLHLDYDECLCSSLYASDEKHADQLLEIYGQYWEGVKFHIPDDGWYVSFIRSWSRDLIKHFQSELGEDNVGILSWGSMEYVLRSANLLDVGISPNNTFVREDMGFHVPRFKNKNNVLVDNETWSFHREGMINKYNFLFCPPSEKFVNVTNFDVRYFDEGLDITLEELIVKIEKAFEHKNID